MQAVMKDGQSCFHCHISAHEETLHLIYLLFCAIETAHIKEIFLNFVSQILLASKSHNNPNALNACKNIRFLSATFQHTA